MVNPIHTDTTIMKKSILYSACKFQERIYACELVRLYNTYSTIQYINQMLYLYVYHLRLFQYPAKQWGLGEMPLYVTF